MHTLTDIDHLGHTTVPNDGRKRVGFFVTHWNNLLGGQPMDGLLDSDLHRLIQILVVAHEDPVCVSFSPWPIRLHILAHDRPNLDLLVGTFKRCEIDLTIALPAMRISGPDQTAF